MADIKQSGQVFTPLYLVCDILNAAGYVENNIRKKHIIDNSCGNGAFLSVIVQRYIIEFLKESKDAIQLKSELETYIHGIELDSVAYIECIANLNDLVKDSHLEDVRWDILNTDTLSVNQYDGKMDFVVGNPPYVRVHNLENYNAVKQFKFAEGGMTDLYLVFFEIGFNMLKSGGKLCYITPSSWINSVAGSVLRQYTLKNHNLVRVIDLGHYQAFEATTYTMISLFQKDIKHDTFTYSIYKPNNGTPYSLAVEDLTIEETMINGVMYLANRKTLNELRQIFTGKCKQYVQVKNGFATLADSVFIRSFFPFTEYVIPIIKASTGKWYKAFFPYDKNGKPLPQEQIFNNVQIAQYLEENAPTLLKGRTKEEMPDWYLFGRTQALKDVASNKYSINTIVIDKSSIKLNKVPAGSGIYSGLYILTAVPEDILRDVIYNEDFIKYISTLKKYKSGGYYTFNSKELENYLNYKLSNLLNENNYAEQPDLFTSNI